MVVKLGFWDGLWMKWIWKTFHIIKNYNTRVCPYGSVLGASYSLFNNGLFSFLNPFLGRSQHNFILKDVQRCESLVKFTKKYGPLLRCWVNENCHFTLQTMVSLNSAKRVLSCRLLKLDDLVWFWTFCPLCRPRYSFSYNLWQTFDYWGKFSI
jgi:hypothetical protein